MTLLIVLNLAATIICVAQAQWDAAATCAVFALLCAWMDKETTR